MHRVLVLALLHLVGCSESERTQAFTLRIAAPGTLASFHPHTRASFTTAALDLVYQPVLRVGKDGEILPGCVRRWERVAAGTIRVQEDPDLRFSDGSPVRSEDLIHSITTSGLEARRVGDWIEIGAGSSPDPLEVALLYTTLIRESEPAPLGSGPFHMVEADAGHIVLERVRQEPGRITRVEVESVPTARDAFAKALRGDANAVAGLDERQSELMEGVPALRVVRGAAPHALAVALNATRLSKGERLALAAAMPVADLARAYGGNCAPLNAPPAHPPPPPGRPLQVAASTHDPGLPRAALALRRALGARGGDLAAESLARNASRLRAHDFDLLVGTVIAWPPTMLGWFARTGAGANFAGYSNPRVDDAFERGDMATVLDEMRRDPPLVLVCRRQRIAAVDARLKNATLGSWGLLETLAEWEVSP